MTALTLKAASMLLALGLATLGTAPLAAAPDLSKLPPASDQKGVIYAKDIRPLFEASCFRCHGTEKPKAGLRLDSLEAVLKGGKDGKVVQPGKSETSLLVIAVARIDDESAMPPKPRRGRGPGGPGNPPGGSRGASQPAAGNAGGATPSPGGEPRRPMGPMPKPLTPEQVGLVRAWVDQGAK